MCWKNDGNETAELSIFDLFNDHQILHVVAVDGKKKEENEKDLFVYGESQPRLLLIDNKSVSFLIKCPMPVIEPRVETNDGKEAKRWNTRRKKSEIFTLKSQHTKQKTNDTMSLIFSRFHEVVAKYAFCLEAQAFQFCLHSSHMLRSTSELVLPAD